MTFGPQALLTVPMSIPWSSVQSFGGSTRLSGLSGNTQLAGNRVGSSGAASSLGALTGSRGDRGAGARADDAADRLELRGRPGTLHRRLGLRAEVAGRRQQVADVGQPRLERAYIMATIALAERAGERTRGGVAGPWRRCPVGATRWWPPRRCRHRARGRDRARAPSSIDRQGSRSRRRMSWTRFGVTRCRAERGPARPCTSLPLRSCRNRTRSDPAGGGRNTCTSACRLRS